MFNRSCGDWNSQLEYFTRTEQPEWRPIYYLSQLYRQRRSSTNCSRWTLNICYEKHNRHTQRFPWSSRWLPCHRSTVTWISRGFSIIMVHTRWITSCFGSSFLLFAPSLRSDRYKNLAVYTTDSILLSCSSIRFKLLSLIIVTPSKHLEQIKEAVHSAATTMQESK